MIVVRDEDKKKLRNAKALQWGGLGAIGAGILGGTLTKRTVPAAMLGIAGIGASALGAKKKVELYNKYSDKKFDGTLMEAKNLKIK